MKVYSEKHKGYTVQVIVPQKPNLHLQTEMDDGLLNDSGFVQVHPKSVPQAALRGLPKVLSKQQAAKMAEALAQNLEVQTVLHKVRLIVEYDKVQE